MEKLEFSELKEGMRVQDKYKNISIIVKCKNIHNILVKFETICEGGYGFYNIDEKHLRYDPLYKIK